jgi:4-hydroxy-tetrahydrodipicolinate reductase
MVHGLAIVGYGKMGKLIESFAPEYGFEVRVKLDVDNNAGFEGITAEKFRGIDAAIEFSVPSAVPENVRRISALGVNMVVGATGWLEQIDEVRKVVEEAGTGLVWSPNFSVGMQAFFRIVAEAAKLMSNEKLYESWAWEIHHSAKKDAPSGTLLKLVEEMKSAGYHRKIDVASNRAGAIPGTHEIGFDSAADTVTLRHTARSREGFARGALKAAQWVIGKRGFFEFREILFQ